MPCAWSWMAVSVWPWVVPGSVIETRIGTQLEKCE